MTTVFVAGYPRSGTCWMAWLLSDILDAPIDKKDSPLAHEDVDRKGPHRIRHQHYVPRRGRRGKLVSGDRLINLSHIRGNKLVHMIRDPRDVSVSQMYWWRKADLLNAMAYMGGKGDKAPHEWLKLGWVAYVSSWENCTWEHSTVRYEKMLDDPKGCMTELLQELGFEIDEERIAQAIVRQAFDVKRKQIENTLHLRLLGEDLNLRNLRKGVSGDWKNHYHRQHAELAQEIFGDMMLKLGYIEDEQWWKEID